MTQLIIDGHEAVLPQNFSTTVKRENSFFTKNGEYTYDCTLKLDNPVNCELYGFLQRLNKTEQIETRRTATLIADGHVYTRGTEIVTRWTEESVTIQIVSGESELNYFIGQDQKIEELNMGSVATIGALDDPKVCYPTVVDAGTGVAFNKSVYVLGQGQSGGYWIEGADLKRHQPRLCPLVRMVIEALGYTIGTDQLSDTFFQYAFLVNTIKTDAFAKMLPGWTVKDFLTEVEKLTGVVFVTNNTDPDHPTCDIILKPVYYQNAQQFTLRNVVDAYEVEVDDEDTDEMSTKDISYDLPDNSLSKHQRLPRGFIDTVNQVDCDNYNAVRETLATAPANTVATDTTTGRKYIARHVSRQVGAYAYAFAWRQKFDVYYNVRMGIYEEVDYLADLIRGDSNGNDSVKLAIVPAPIDWFAYRRIKNINAPEDIEGYRWGGLLRAVTIPSGEVAVETEDTEDNGDSSNDDGDDYDIYDSISDYQPPSSDSSKAQLYIALCNGDHYRDGALIPVAYIDAYQETLATAALGEPDTNYEGSLTLGHLDAELYSNGYEIDTRHALTIETYDPNVIDPRQLYVIRNKRYVCKEVEEVITAEGRQKKWKGVFFPIHVSDESQENRWVLTHGVWDDHAVWLDDGRWNDDYDGAIV